MIVIINQQLENSQLLKVNSVNYRRWNYKSAAFFYFSTMKINEISSAIYNDIMSGLINITSDPNISLEQLEDEVVEERQAVIKEW